MCLCGTDVQYSFFVSPDRYQYRLRLSTDSNFCMQLGTPISMPTTRTPLIGRLYFIYQSIGQIISFQMMPPLRSFDDLDWKERGQKKTDDLRAMTTLGPRTLATSIWYDTLMKIVLRPGASLNSPQCPIWIQVLQEIDFEKKINRRQRHAELPSRQRVNQHTHD